MRYIFIIILAVMMNACGLAILNGTGTHGNLGEYSYSLPKEKLDSLIELTINNKTNKIQKLETDGDEYTSILIKTAPPYFFVIRFYGDEEYLKSHPNDSKIFITAIKKGDEEYKSERDISKGERTEGVKIFEEYFIVKLDSICFGHRLN